MDLKNKLIKPEINELTQQIEYLQKKLLEANQTIETQKKENLKLHLSNTQLQQDLIIKDSLSKKLSSIHLNQSQRSDNEEFILLQKNNELNQAQTHILKLGKIVLKNRQTIDKLRKIKQNDEILSHQIAELIEEKDFLWNVVINVHEELTNQPHTSDESKYDKAYEVLNLIKSEKNKKYKP